jgi:hypothetical protein
MRLTKQSRSAKKGQGFAMMMAVAADLQIPAGMASMGVYRDDRASVRTSMSPSAAVEDLRAKALDLRRILASLCDDLRHTSAPNWAFTSWFTAVTLISRSAACVSADDPDGEDRLARLAQNAVNLHRALKRVEFANARAELLRSMGASVRAHPLEVMLADVRELVDSGLWGEPLEQLSLRLESAFAA